jgi:hypothetical protein
VFLSEGSSKTQPIFFAKIVSKGFCKKIDQKSTFLGVLGEESSKTPLKIKTPLGKTDFEIFVDFFVIVF